MNATTTARPDTFWRRYLRNPVSATALGIFAVIALVAVFAPALSPFDPLKASLDAVNAPWSSTHPLGADGSGRDVLSRLIWGSRSSLMAAFIAIFVAVLIGVPTGLLAGFYGGLVDSVGTWFADLLLALPAIVALLATVAAFGPGIGPSMIVLGVLFSPSFFRLTRITVLSVRGSLFVDAAIVSGLSDARIIVRHVLGVVRSPIIIQVAMMAGLAIAIQAGLEFLGLGDQATPSWGGMLNDAFALVYVDPIGILPPGIAMTVTIASLALIGSGLRDALAVGAHENTRPRRMPRRAVVRQSVAPAAASAEVLSVRNLTVTYSPRNGAAKSVVKGVSFDVHAGEILGIVGESGSGKSQTAFAIMGLLDDGATTDADRLLLGEHNLLSLDQRARARLLGRSIAYVPQEPLSNLDPSFTIGHQLMVPLRRVSGLTKDAARRRALVLLEKVGIADPAGTLRLYPHQISGGMAQRILIAGAVAASPDLLVADEPTTALDVSVQAEVLDLLRELRSETGMSILLITHNFGVVSDLCDRVAVMSDGIIVEQGETRDILRDPQHPYTTMLLGAMIGEDQLRTDLDVERRP